MAPALKPLRAFHNIEEWANRHRAGTEVEFAADQKMIEQINKENNKYRAWILSKTRQTPKRIEYLVVVQFGPDGERKMPQQGEPARLRVVFADNTATRSWECRRIENPVALTSFKTDSAEKLATYHVTVHIADSHDGIHPLIDTTPASRTTPESPAAAAKSNDAHSDSASSSHDDSGISDCSPVAFLQKGDAGKLALTAANAVHVNFWMTASEATKNAELDALEHFCGRHKGNVSERQEKAFEYFVLLRNPDFFVDLHEQIPHLLGAMKDSSWPASPLGKKFALLNSQQKAAYIHGFRKLQCGICILPGGPGAGKTHFNLTTIAIAQSKPLPRPVMVHGQPEKRCPKVLFIVDMNSPVDDVANRMVRLNKEIGSKKLVIRMRGWGSEVKASDRLNAVEDAGSEDIHVDFTTQFLQTRNLMSLAGGSARRGCDAPSLDEAAWQRYDEFKDTKYEGLTEYLKEELFESSDIVPLTLRRLIYNLYRDTLAAADFIATTPVAASNHFRGMFKPDLVYFDEAPHARELTNLTAIAGFDPIAWFFLGDWRQTVPYVGSATADSDNVFREQMQVSMMERAAVAGVIKHDLLMNHRAFGGLEQLASTMWYAGRMVSGNEGRTPDSVVYSRHFLERFSERPCTVPRLLVHLHGCGPERRDGTSAWNPAHITWTMGRALELLNDPKFKHAEREEPGTILILSMYKAAVNEYRKAIKKLPSWAQRRVEVRTVDVAQGHEADFVFLDLVKDKSTKFLDDPNRLNVALTRARVGEIVVMHPNIVYSATLKKNSRSLRRIYELCKQAGQVAYIGSDVKAVQALGSPSLLASEHNSAAGAVADIASNMADSAGPVTQGRGATPASQNSAPVVPVEKVETTPVPVQAVLAKEGTDVAAAVASATGSIGRDDPARRLALDQVDDFLKAMDRMSYRPARSVTPKTQVHKDHSAPASPEVQVTSLRLDVSEKVAIENAAICGPQTVTCDLEEKDVESHSSAGTSDMGDAEDNNNELVTGESETPTVDSVTGPVDDGHNASEAIAMRGCETSAVCSTPDHGDTSKELVMEDSKAEVPVPPGSLTTTDKTVHMPPAVCAADTNEAQKARMIAALDDTSVFWNAVNRPRRPAQVVTPKNAPAKDPGTSARPAEIPSEPPSKKDPEPRLTGLPTPPYAIVQTPPTASPPKGEESQNEESQDRESQNRDDVMHSLAEEIVTNTKPADALSETSSMEDSGPTTPILSPRACSIEDAATPGPAVCAVNTMDDSKFPNFWWSLAFPSEADSVEEVSANKKEAVDVVSAHSPAKDTAIASNIGVKGEAGAVPTSLQIFSCTIEETSTPVQIGPVAEEDGAVGAQTPTPNTVTNTIDDVDLGHNVAESPALELTATPVVPAVSWIPEKTIGTSASCAVDAKDEWEAVEATACNVDEEDRPESSARTTPGRIQYSFVQLLSLRNAAVNPPDWLASISDLPKPSARASRPIIPTPEHADENLHTSSQDNACKQAEAMVDKAPEVFNHTEDRESLLAGALKKLEERADRAAETLRRVEDMERSLVHSLKDSEERAAKVAEALRSAEDRERGLACSLKDSEERADRLAEALRRAEDRELKFTKALDEYEEKADKMARALERAGERELRLAEALQGSEERVARVVEALQCSEAREGKLVETLQGSEERAARVIEALQCAERREGKLVEALRKSEQRVYRVAQTVQESERKASEALIAVGNKEHELVEALDRAEDRIRKLTDAVAEAESTTSRLAQHETQESASEEMRHHDQEVPQEVGRDARCLPKDTQHHSEDDTRSQANDKGYNRAGEDVRKMVESVMNRVVEELGVAQALAMLATVVSRRT